MKIKQKYAVCFWGRYTVMTYLFRDIVKTCELLSTSPFRKVLNRPAVGAEVWALPLLPQRAVRPTQPGTVPPMLPGDAELLQTYCMCAHICPLPVTCKKRCRSLEWLGNQHWKC